LTTLSATISEVQLSYHFR